MPSSIEKEEIPILNEEKVDNTLDESPKSSPTRTSTPSKVKVTYPVDISSDEEEEESESEFDSLSPELGSVATKPNAKVVATSTSKGFVQTKFVPDLIKWHKTNIATKEKQPIIATESKKTESDDSEDSDESDEEFDVAKEEDEEVHAKTTSESSASTKDKGKGIQSSNTQGYVATNPYSPFFFIKQSES